MLEARVGRLESDVSDIKAILRRLEPVIVGLAQDTARKGDIDKLDDKLAETRDKLAQTREEMVEMRGNLGGRMEGLLQTKTFIMWMIGLFLALAALVFRLGA